MKISQRIKAHYQQFINDTSGKRFINHYNRGRESKAYGRRISEITIGTFLILAGILFGFLPFIPGWIFVLTGILLISNNSKFISLMLDRLEIWVRKKILRKPIP